MTDLISRADAIDELRHLIPYKRYKSGGFVHLLDKREVFKAINSLPSADADWIPCSERLPSDAKEVLVCMKNGWIDTASYRGNKKHWRFDATDVAPCDLILAWMPLPTPYKGGDDE